MILVALIGIVDQRRPGESSTDAAHRELAEETGIRHDLAHLGDHVLPCAVHGEDHVALFAARTSPGDADVACGEGRQIVFVDPADAHDLDLTDATRALLPTVLAHA